MRPYKAVVFILATLGDTVHTPTLEPDMTASAE
ncbi:ferredoxin--NADP(+) reductase, partial [Enterococcus faecium]